MGNLAFLAIAVIVSIIGSLYFVFRHRTPTSPYSSIDAFTDRMSALDPTSARSVSPVVSPQRRAQGDGRTGSGSPSDRSSETETGTSDSSQGAGQKGAGQKNTAPGASSPEGRLQSQGGLNSSGTRGVAAAEPTDAAGGVRRKRATGAEAVEAAPAAVRPVESAPVDDNDPEGGRSDG